MVGKAIRAAAAVCVCIGSVYADEVREGSDLGLLYWIRDTVCMPGEPVVFIPVSDDVPALDETYAVVPAGHLDSDTAHVVTGNQRAWLSRHGCSASAAQQRQVEMQLASGRFDF